MEIASWCFVRGLCACTHLHSLIHSTVVCASCCQHKSLHTCPRSGGRNGGGVSHADACCLDIDHPLRTVLRRYIHTAKQGCTLPNWNLALRRSGLQDEQKRNIPNTIATFASKWREGGIHRTDYRGAVISEQGGQQQTLVAFRISFNFRPAKLTQQAAFV